MPSLIRTVIFPIAGLGTRFLPATKAVSKEMLTVVDRPLIQYAVEEAISAGIVQFVFIVPAKSALAEKHFERNLELEGFLEQESKFRELEAVKNSNLSIDSMQFVVQDEPLGLGHAVLCAKEFVDEEYFAIVLPDDLVLSRVSCLKQMVDVHLEINSPVIAIEEVDSNVANRYGIVVPGDRDNDIVQIKGVVEKPNPALAPSNMAVIGRYLLSKNIFALLEKQEPGVGGEIQLTDAINALTNTNSAYALKFQGKRYDCGQKAGYVAANIAYALNDKEISDQVFKFLNEVNTNPT